MVSFLKYLCVDNSQKQQEQVTATAPAKVATTTKNYDNGDNGQSVASLMQLSSSVSGDSEDTDQFSARSTPSTQRATFQAMLMDIQNSQGGKLDGWSLRKIHQYTNYLSDRLRKSKAFRGYFQIICRMVDVLRGHLANLVQDGMQLPKKLDKEALIMTLMCVQALNKVYGRRSDVRASPHILVEKVAADFQAVSKSLIEGILSVDRSLQVQTQEFIVPRDSRLLIAELKRQIKLKVMMGNEDGEKVKEDLVSILSAHRIRVCDFTQGDLIWLEREGMQQQQTNSKQNNNQQSQKNSNLDAMQLVLQYILHIVQPQTYPQPLYQQ